MSRRQSRAGHTPASDRPPPQGPAVDLLDALRRGEWADALTLLDPDAIVSAPQFDLTASGDEEISALAGAALARFPDLAYQPHVRHAGPGVILDEGFATGTASEGPAAGHQMTTTLKVAARDDGERVHRLIVTVDPTPVMRALGRPVDRATALYSEVQALRAGMFTGLDVHTLAPASLAAAQPPPGPTRTRGHHGLRRASVPIAIVGALLTVGGVGAVVLGSGGDDKPTADAPSPTSSAPAPATTPRPTPTRKPRPTVVLATDLAFASNSAAISPAFRQEILRLAARARTLTGVIRVDGYTDNVGSAESGDRLSRARADAVAAVLRAALGDIAGLTIRAVGHGEADPVASNTSAAGRAQNRRVTITLPPAPQDKL